MQRWKWNNYTFIVNPDTQGENIEIIGDNVRTLSGAYVSQPTGRKDTFAMESNFYQPRTRVLREFSFANMYGFQVYGNYIYGINRTLKTLDIFNKTTLAATGQVTLSGVDNTNLVASYVYNSGIWAVSNGTSSDDVYSLTSSGALAYKRTVPWLNGERIQGIYYYLTRVYVIRQSVIDVFSTPGFTRINTFSIPYITGGYTCISGDKDVLMVGGNDAENGNIMYYIDSASGRIADSVYEDEIKLFNTISYDGANVYMYNRTNGTMQVVFCNTVILDMFRFRYETMKLGYIILVDDMGITTRVAVTGINKQRTSINEKTFRVSMSVQKIDVAR